MTVHLSSGVDSLRSVQTVYKRAATELSSTCVAAGDILTSKHTSSIAHNGTRMLPVDVYRQTLRWESSLWLNGRQVYLGGFATEQEAAHAYDLAALGCKGPSAEINFSLAQYADMTTELQFLSQVHLCPACPSYKWMYLPLPMHVVKHVTCATLSQACVCTRPEVPCAHCGAVLAFVSISMTRMCRMRSSPGCGAGAMLLREESPGSGVCQGDRDTGKHVLAPLVDSKMCDRQYALPHQFGHLACFAALFNCMKMSFPVHITMVITARKNGRNYNHESATARQS